jgi:hypothetical protein
MGRVVSSLYTWPGGFDLSVCELRDWRAADGRDEDKVFFVERSELGWDEYAGKHVTLTRMLSESAIIFVQPIQPTALHRAIRFRMKRNLWAVARKETPSSG